MYHFFSEKMPKVKKMTMLMWLKIKDNIINYQDFSENNNNKYKFKDLYDLIYKAKELQVRGCVERHTI